MIDQGYSYGMSELVCALHIKEYTQEGNIVYDPFMGSGTTGVACIKTGRKYIGSEVDEKVKNIAERRLTVGHTNH